MGQVVIHAGMPKTGSTSVQTWLREQAGHLRADLGVHVLREVPRPDGTLDLRVFDGGPAVMTAGFLLRYWALLQRDAPYAERAACATELVDGLDRAAGSLGRVLVTAEGFARLFNTGEAPFLAALDELAARHEVLVAYYVRPQHEALESRWRQWGFLADTAPARWVLEDAERLDYLATATTVARLAPRLDFDVRLFREDVLPGGSVVVDFARNVLGHADPPGAEDLRDNPGLPLDLAILLRDAPDGVARAEGDGFDPGLRQVRLSRLAHRWAVPESPAARRSREVLHAFAHDAFEDANRDLADEAGWPVDGLIPPPPVAPAEVEVLDELWGPQASPTAQAYLHAALATLVEDDPAA